MKKRSALKIHPTSPDQAAGKTGRWFACLVLTLIVCLGVLGSGCAPGVEASCSENADANSFIEKLNVTDPQFRFTYPGHPELLPSNHFWFSGGDTNPQNPNPIVYGVNGVTLDLREKGAPDNCTFNGQGGCYQCDLCASSLNSACNNGTQIGIITESFPLLILTEEDSATKAVRTLQSHPNPGNVCFMRPGLPGSGSFTPQKNATIKLKKSHPCGTIEEIAEFKTEVVNTPRDLPPADLETHTEPLDPGVQRFVFTVDLTDGVLAENFSPDLRVTKVTVVASVVNEATNQVEFVETPEALRAVRPSRILFLPDFQGDTNNHHDEGTNRCYVDAIADDGNFDVFRNCRKNPNSPELLSHDVTPTYVNSPGERHRLLTWILEYKVSDGLPGPPDFSKGRPAIKFTLEER